LERPKRPNTAKDKFNQTNAHMAERNANQRIEVEKLERAMGIEPTSKAWEALVLPLNYTRVVNWRTRILLDFVGTTK
jgi:hypothetical protein